MPVTYEPIATTTLGSTQSTVTFSSISGAYTDLVLVSSALSAGTSQTIMMRFNGDSANNYSFTYVFGTGSVALSGTVGSISFAIGGSAVATNAAVNIVQIMNYSNSTTNKTVLGRRGQAGNYTFADVSLWRNTAAITSISLQPENSQSFASGSTFTLYGIKAA
jgi:hypothetical protein